MGAPHASPGGTLLSWVSVCPVRCGHNHCCWCGTPPDCYHTSSPEGHLQTVITPPPLQGTTLITYTNYPSFAPHTVLDWETYDRPLPQVAAVATSPAPFLERVFQDRGGWIRWAGGEGVHTTGWEGRRDGGGWIRWGGSR